MNAIDALIHRVSGRVLIEPAPNQEELDIILTSALRAPDHGRLRPWNFVVIKGKGRHRLGEVMVESFKKKYTNATDLQIDKERSKPLRAPLIIAVCAKVNKQSKIPEIEQLFSAAAAAQNIMTASFALGFGCAWKTGDSAYDNNIKRLLGLADTDSIVGFMYIGTNERVLDTAPKLEHNSFVNFFE
jgi:hypothetical protein